ncbi:Mitogen-activated protein kinase kinase kinase 1-like protein [Drosera capensis]
MLTRLVPYHPLEPMTALYRIGRGIPPPIPPSLSRDARDFIMLCLQANPSDRPSAADLLHHPFVRRPLPTGSESPLFPGRWVSSTRLKTRVCAESPWTHCSHPKSNVTTGTFGRTELALRERSDQMAYLVSSAVCWESRTREDLGAIVLAEISLADCYFLRQGVHLVVSIYL